MRNELLCVFLSSVLAILGPPKEVGKVSGHVYVGERSEPVVAASDYLQPLDQPSAERRSIVVTESAGRFSIEAEAGRYAIHAFKPEDGYPDIFFAFNLAPDHTLKEVTITPGKTLDNVEIKLGPKPAVLTFRVTDAETGLVISGADYELCQLRHPDWCVRGGAPGKTEFSAPPTQISIQVGSEGYKTVKHSEDNKAFVSLAPGEHKEILIALRRNR